MPICKNCNDRFPNSIKIEGVWKFINKRKYCLNCSPYKEHNTRKLEINIEHKTCPACNKEKTIDEFYVRKNRKDPSPYCKECSRKEGTTRARLKKIKAVDYKGGKCQECGYSKCIGALEFHHIDPSIKESNISRMYNTWDKIKLELDKCVLLCNRCHREVEDGILIL